MLARLAAVDPNVCVCDEPDAERHHRLQLPPRMPGARPASGTAAAGPADRRVRRCSRSRASATRTTSAALFRSAAAFDIDGILLDPTSGDPFYRKAIRTSMGAVLRLPFARAAGLAAGLDAFREQGFRLIALTPDPDALPIAEFARPASRRSASGPARRRRRARAWTRRRMSRADARVRIPIDARVDSLNVTVAAEHRLDHLCREFEGHWPMWPAGRARC